MNESSPETRARAHFPGVRAPKRLLSAATEGRLTARQLELLEELEQYVATASLAELTMAEIAAQTNSSLRTLYGIAPSKDALVLTVVDRCLHRIGRAAVGSLDTSMSPLEMLRSYLRAANEAVQPTTVAFSQELAHIRDAQPLLDAHEDYVIAVAKSLLDRAVEEGEIAPVNTAAVAHVLGGLGREFSRLEPTHLSSASPKESADAVAEILLRGLLQK